MSKGKTKVPESIPKLNEKIEDLQAQKIELHLQSEEDRIKDIKCKTCNTRLRVKPEAFMEPDSKPSQSYECPKCERLNKVTVRYPHTPRDSMAEITVQGKDYAWNTLPASKLSDIHIEKWIRDEARKVKENKSTLPMKEEQIIIRALDLALNKK